MNNAPILVTGATGFIAAHTVLLLLEQGYRVRGTLRDLKREPELRATLAQHTQATDSLEFVRADLLQDDGWAEAVRGCEYVIHIASPFPLLQPQDENELIAPARDGTLRVLKAAQAEGVKRVVIVSSSSAVLHGHEGENRTFDEKDWAKLDGRVDAYAKSKTLAERAAWEFITSTANTNGMELVAVNPGYVFGPFLDKHYAGSMELVSTLMKHQVPGVSHSKISIVDVRDVAAALSSALSIPDAAGKRFCCVTVTPWLQSIAMTLHKHFASRGYRVPTRVFPNFMIRALALFDPKIAIIVPSLDWDFDVSSERAKTILHWQPLPPEQTIVDMGESLIALGLV